MKISKKKMVMYRNLRKSERVIWCILLACLFFLFYIGIELEYERVNSIVLTVVHTITVIMSFVFAVSQVLVVERINALEEEIFDEE